MKTQRQRDRKRETHRIIERGREQDRGYRYWYRYRKREQQRGIETIREKDREA